MLRLHALGLGAKRLANELDVPVTRCDATRGRADPFSISSRGGHPRHFPTGHAAPLAPTGALLPRRLSNTPRTITSMSFAVSRSAALFESAYRVLGVERQMKRSSMPTCVYLVINSRGSWWVDRDGNSYGPCRTRQEAIQSAHVLAGVLRDSRHRAEIWAPDEGGKMRLIWRGEPAPEA